MGMPPAVPRERCENEGQGCVGVCEKRQKWMKERQKERDPKRDTG